MRKICVPLLKNVIKSDLNLKDRYDEGKQKELNAYLTLLNWCPLRKLSTISNWHPHFICIRFKFVHRSWVVHKLYQEGWRNHRLELGWRCFRAYNLLQPEKCWPILFTTWTVQQESSHTSLPKSGATHQSTNQVFSASRLEKFTFIRVSIQKPYLHT